MDSKEEVSMPVHAGDAVFIDMLIFHKSGLNVSNRFRFTAITRFHDASRDDFIPFLSIERYNGYVKKLLEETGEDCSDVADPRLEG